jgi:hypothetical protein
MALPAKVVIFSQPEYRQSSTQHFYAVAEALSKNEPALIREACDLYIKEVMADKDFFYEP